METPSPEPDPVRARAHTAPLGPEGDPGYVRSLLTPNTPRLAALRLAPAAMLAMLPFMGLVLYYVLESLLAWSPLTLALPGLGVLAIAAAAVPFVRALPPETSSDDAARGALNQVRTAALLRMALCEIPALVGMAASFLQPGGSLLPYAAGVVISCLGMFTLALPTRSVLERDRARLEARGATSYLWNALLSNEAGSRP